MMTNFQVSMDTSLNTGYLQLLESDVARTIALTDEINLDLNDDGQLVGIEYLSLFAQIPVPTLFAKYQLNEYFQKVVVQTQAVFNSSSTRLAAEGTLKARETQHGELVLTA